MPSLRDLVVFLLLSALGLIVWISISWLSGRIEAWDSSVYFLVGLPVMMLSAAIAGYFVSGRPSVWGIAVVWLQPVVLFTGGESGPLWIVGAFTFCVLTGLCVLGAYLGASARRRRGNGETHF